MLQTPSPYNRIPPVSLSPPQQGQGSRVNDIGSVDRELAQLRLPTFTSPSPSPATRRRSNTSTDTETDMSMGAIVAALDNLDNDRSTLRLLSPSPRSRSPLNDDGSLLTPRPSPRRRRSSSVLAEPHNVRDETPPNDRFNAVAFQKALSGTQTLMGELAKVLGSGGFHRKPGSVLSQLYAQAQGLSDFECPSRRTVGFVGDSGVEFQNNGAAACTCVATEYHYRSGDDCVIKVEWYSPDDIRKQVKDLLLSYRHYHLHGNDPDACDDEELLDEEDRRASENRARLAIDTFKAMFLYRMENEAFLLDCLEEEVLHTMYRWLEETEKLLTEEENITAGLGECAGILSRLTSEEPSADGPTVWPFIKKIKAFVDAHILSKGLVLVDLPGLRDVNSARRNITERYILQCDEIFVMCMMGRIITDRSIEDIFNLAQQADRSNIGIICTNSDHFEAEEERDNCRDEQRRRMIQDKIDACDLDRDTIQSINEELDIEDWSDEEEMAVEQRDVQRSLFREKRKADIQKYLMEIRAQRISDQLREKYGDGTASRNLAVFFVSNTMYWDNRQEPRNRAVPRLELSGILAVRQYCRGMVSESQFALASTFMRDDVNALLGNIELWLRSGAESMTVERIRLVREGLKVVERQMRKSYAAFCSNFGTHHTKSVGAHCWNEKIMKAMNGSMEPLWSALSKSFETRIESITSIVARFMNWTVKHLAELRLPPDSFEMLTEVLTSRERLLMTAIKNAWSDFDDSLRRLQRDATKPMRTSFNGQGMESAYQAANCELGSGAHGRRKSRINEAISDKNLFLTILRNSRAEFNALTSTLEGRVRETVAEHAALIVETLDIVRGDNAAPEADEDPAFRGRVEGEVGRVRGLMRTLITTGDIVLFK
ncbi:hypothetical protein F4859DRAFT_522291 [Xylaria cf. heliscus]|nr:hypothetical protein F4859DRAFT_522291 [Xylaria cf. heliscus]